ncbi:MAG: VOC family protein [Emticicia sp.]|uniref:VOC family protein n=1 Tax=Emticicia sp. TaxID=1930953 RepID=UPI003BA4AB3A
MEIDHIFIFSNTNGSEADKLEEFGFTEGSSRVHPGQGTVNRKFYFENFFLEILWVHNETEIKSDLILPTKLWERANFSNNTYSPLGLCLVNTDDTDALFRDATKYQPEYFPEGLKIDVLTNETNPSLPWTFRLPFKGDKKKTSEPTEHSNNISRLTKAEFSFLPNDKSANFLKAFENQANISFISQQAPSLILTFDEHRQGKTKIFDDLSLMILY